MTSLGDEGTELLVLAGGFGTRLRAAVADVPKPLAPIHGRPFLEFQIAHWIKQRVTSMTFLLYYEAEKIQSFLDAMQREAARGGCRLRSVVEPSPLGTGGAIAHAVRRLELSGTFIVANADTWLGGGVQDVSQSASPAVAVVAVEDVSRYGSVRLRGDRVVEFTEKSSNTGRKWINGGLYHLHADLFRDWDGKSYSLERELLPKLSSDGRLWAVRLQTDFVDIGVPEDYFRFCRWIDSGRVAAL
jgi:NDP-sugar pyrophosphorylase family protein